MNIIDFKVNTFFSLYNYFCTSFFHISFFYTYYI